MSKCECNTNDISEACACNYMCNYPYNHQYKLYTRNELDKKVNEKQNQIITSAIEIIRLKMNNMEISSSILLDRNQFPNELTDDYFPFEFQDKIVQTGYVPNLISIWPIGLFIDKIQKNIAYQNSYLLPPPYNVEDLTRCPKTLALIQKWLSETNPHFEVKKSKVAPHTHVIDYLNNF
jgi:hypothetical protein